MTADFFQCLQWIFQSGWKMFTGIYFPGTNITPGAMILFGAMTFIVFKWLSAMLDTKAPSLEDKSKGKKDE